MLQIDYGHLLGESGVVPANNPCLNCGGEPAGGALCLLHGEFCGDKRHGGVSDGKLLRREHGCLQAEVAGLLEVQVGHMPQEPDLTSH
ncbi:hypothetical protein [Candidatus Ferrigenium straubiae]|jgi:hypothetical protein|uniref:hypothetical protein n=1 Tax=Candidatus Ferrigenium straubiae TaxID=2919506 RepID=UPI003F4A8A82